MSPDDELPTGTAVAEPEVEDEAVPQAEEPADEVVPAEEEVDPGQAVLDALAELEEANPELAQKLRERYQPDETAFDEERFREELGQSKEQRQNYLIQTYRSQQAWLPQQVAQAGLGWFDEEVAKPLAEQAKKLRDEGAGELQLPRQQFAEVLSEAAQEARSAERAFNTAAFVSSAMDAIEDHQAWRHVPRAQRQDIRKAFGAKPPNEAVALAIKTLADAAIAAAPENVKAEAKAEADKTLKQAEAMKKLLDAVGSNGARKLRGGGTPGSGKSDDELLADRKTPISKIEEILKRQGKL